MKLFGYNLKINITKEVALSYARHAITAAVGMILATAAAHHTSFLAFTKSEWLEVANALWLATVPTLRHFIEKQAPEIAPLVDAVLPATPTA